MATEHDYYPDQDTHIRSNAATTNYETNISLFCGEYGSSSRRHVLLDFDISALAGQVQDITKAQLHLAEISNNDVSGSMTVARLSQSWTEAGATWNTYDGSNAWPGGGGAYGDADTGQGTVTLTVGVAGDQTLDVLDLVRDAIAARAGTLSLVIYRAAATGTQEQTRFGSRERTSEADRPKLTVTVGERIAWLGTSDTDASTAANWAGGSAPGTTDIALFSSGSNDCLIGSLICDRIHVGPGYTGDIGATDTMLSVRVTSEIVIAKRRGVVALDISATTPTVRIADTGQVAGETIIAGSYSAVISGGRSRIELRGDTIGAVDIHGRGIVATVKDTPTAARLGGSIVILEEGAGAVTASAGARLRLLNGTEKSTAITVAGGGRVTNRVSAVGAVTIYQGRLDLDGSEVADADHGAVTIYQGGTLDARTGAGTFEPTSVTVYGGRLIQDAATTSAIA